MKYKLFDRQLNEEKDEVFNNKKEILEKLASYHDNDYTGVKDDDEPYEDIYEFLGTLENDKERLQWLLEYGEWDIIEKNVFIAQKKYKGCEDSFWYDGLIAEYKNAKLYALGDIRVNNKRDELVFDNKPRDEGFEEFKDRNIHNDKQLYWCLENGYYFDNNNWFEILYTDLDGYENSVVLGDDYPEAIQRLIEVGDDDMNCLQDI